MAAGTQHVGQHARSGLQLRIPVLLGLDDPGVQPHAGVVDEHSAIDPGQVDPAFHAVEKGVEGPDHVLPIQPQVEGEVVAGAGRYADVRNVPLGRQRSHQRLGAVPSRHSYDVCASVEDVEGQTGQVVSGPQHDGLDPPGQTLVDQVESLRLPSPRPGIHYEDGVGRAPQCPVRFASGLHGPAITPQAVAGGPGGYQDQDDGNGEGNAPVISRQDDDHHGDQSDGGCRHSQPAGQSPTRHAVPQTENCDDGRHEYDGQPPGIAPRDGESDRYHRSGQTGHR